LNRITVLIIIFFITGCATTGEKASLKSVSFCAAGDVMLDRGVARNYTRSGYEYPFKHTSDFISSFNIAFCNLEGPVTKAEKRKKPFAFRCDPEDFEVFLKSGFNTVSLANNHMLDCGPKGVSETIKVLAENKITFSGAGMTREKALEPAVIYKNGTSFAFLSFCDMPYYVNGKAGSEMLPQPVHPTDEEAYISISRAAASYDNVIVSWHWGVEYSNKPTKRQKELGRMCVDAGAGLVIGHHPHVVQGVEKYRDSIILYSLGNFVFDQYGDKNTESVIFSCRFEGRRIRDAMLSSARIKRSRPGFARDREAEALASAIKKYSGMFGTEFEQNGNRLYIKEN